MRILFLVPDLVGPPGGISRHSRLVCRALAETGSQVDVHALLDTGKSSAMPLNFPTLTYSSYAGSRSAFVASVLGASCHRYDIVLVGHVHFGPVAWFVARAAGAKLAVFVHGIDAWGRLPPARLWAIRHSDRVIAVSRYTANRVVTANGVEREKIRVLHNCLDPTFDPLLTRAPDRSGFTLLTVARLSSSEGYKGHDLVIRAMPALLARHPELTYDIVGDGDGRAHLEKLAEDVGVSRAVSFHGIVSEEELTRRYEQADVFVMPSQAEGFGFVFLEAMAHGKPVIAGDRDAAPEVIEGGVSGILIDPTSRSQFIDAVTTLLDDGDLRERMGQAAAKRVREQFTFERFRSELESHLLGMTASGQADRFCG